MAVNVRSAEERARSVGMWAALTLLFFAAGLLFSLRGFGIEIAPPSDAGSLTPRTVDGTLTYVKVDGGGHAVSCAVSYSASSCSTVGVVVTRHDRKSK